MVPGWKYLLTDLLTLKYMKMPVKISIFKNVKINYFM